MLSLNQPKRDLRNLAEYSARLVRIVPKVIFAAYIVPSRLEIPYLFRLGIPVGGEWVGSEKQNYGFHVCIIFGVDGGCGIRLK